MLLLSIMASVLHVGVVIAAIRFLRRRQRRMGDSNVVKAVLAMSALYLMGQAAAWVHPATMPSVASTSVAYAVTTALFFLALINCFSVYGAQRRTSIPGGVSGRPHPTQ